VELVNRFVRTQGWVTGNIMGNAGQLLDKAPASAFDKHPAGDGYVPVPGDIIVWTGGSTGYGHVAVVSSVVAGVVTFVEQNASRTGSYHLKANEHRQTRRLRFPATHRLPARQGERLAVSPSSSRTQ
jgi:surface antigen